MYTNPISEQKKTNGLYTTIYFILLSGILKLFPTVSIPIIIGQKVDVVYNIAHPNYSKLVNMDPTKRVAGNFLLLIPFFVFLVLFKNQLKRGILRLLVIKEGIVGRAKLIRNSVVSGTDDTKEYELIFLFADKNGKKHSFKTKTRYPFFLEDELYETILYLENNPKTVFVLDDLPHGGSTFFKKMLNEEV